MSIERDICKAIDIISSRAISTASHGTTVLATVVECLNPFNGKYKIKYQSNNFIAYNNNINTFYDAETPVYVFLKNGQLDEELIILGPAHGRNSNNFFSIFKDFDFDIDNFSWNDIFHGTMELKAENGKIKANISYMMHQVAESELLNFKFNWYGLGSGGAWVNLNKEYNGMRISGTSELVIIEPYSTFKCEAVMDNFTFIQTITVK